MRHLIKIIHRHPIDFFRNFLSEPVRHFLRNPRHNISLDKRECSADNIQAQKSNQYFPYFPKINSASAGHLTHQSVKNLRSRLSENLRTYNIKYGSSDSKYKYEENRYFVPAHIVHKLFHSTFKVFCLLSRHCSASHGSTSSSFCHISPPPSYHLPVLFQITEKTQSGNMHHSSLTALYAFQFRRSFHHPAQ